MTSGLARSLGAKITGAVALAAVVVVGVLMRLVDPLSTPVIPAEDPYTHMNLIREHLRTGTLEALNPPGTMYPPGMHAFLSTVLVFSGLELYDLFRIGPAFLGGIGVLGMGLVLWRFVGPIGGFVGALGYAVAPEVIFRTTMMAPTALDLALLPFALYMFAELATGNLRWGIPAAVMVGFLVFAHPWLLGLLAPAAAAFAVASLIAPWDGDARAAPLGLALVLGITMGGFGVAMTGCGGYCGTGFVQFLPDALAPASMGLVVLALAFVPALVLAWQPRLREGITMRPGARMPVWLKCVLSAGFAAALASVTYVAVQQGMPPQVDLPRMLGWPVLGAAAFAFVALPFISGPVALLGGAFAAVTFPLVIFNPFDSPFWSHRTVAFFGFGAMVLLGVGAAALARWGTLLVQTLQQHPKRADYSRMASMLLFVPALLVAFSMGSAVYAGTPSEYDGGWYRLYEPCEMDAFEEILEETEDEEAMIIVGSWQARLVLGSLSEDPSSIGADRDFFYDEEHRKDLMAVKDSEGVNLYVVTDRNMDREHPDMPTEFLEGSEWQHVNGWCEMMGSPEPRTNLYQMQEVYY